MLPRRMSPSRAISRRMPSRLATRVERESGMGRLLSDSLYTIRIAHRCQLNSKSTYFHDAHPRIAASLAGVPAERYRVRTSTAPGGTPRMPHILVIDDEGEVRAVLRRALERAGYEVSEAVDGKEGLRQFRQKPADLIIVDIFMPEKEGLETILEIHEVGKRVKTIAMSGGGMTGSLEYLDYAKKFGVDRTFTKPLDLKEMVETVTTLLGLDRPPSDKQDSE